MSDSADTPAPLLSAHRVDISPASYRPALLSGVNLDLFPGRLHGLAGPNGCGKTTLISALAGFLKPRAGIVRLGHRDMRTLHPADRARSIAVVLTERTDTAFLHVDELVALGRLPFNPGSRLREIDREVCENAMTRLGLEHLRRRKVATLSDGERQRALIARAIAQAPSVLLLDEPTAHLDVAGEVEIISHLLSIAREDNIAVLASSHKLQLMLSWCDALSLIHPDGALVTGVPEELALAGEVSHTFDTPTVRFNTADLRFNSCRPKARWYLIEVDADGEHGIWTRRALERLGFIEREGAPLRLVVENGVQTAGGQTAGGQTAGGQTAGGQTAGGQTAGVGQTVSWRMSGVLREHPDSDTAVTEKDTGVKTRDTTVDAQFVSLSELVGFLESLTLRHTSKQDA